MKSRSKIFLTALGAALAALLLTAAHQIDYDAGGIHIGGSTADKIGFYNATAVTQPTASAQAAITNNTTGTAGTALAAGAGVSTLTFPITALSAVGNADIVSAYVPGYKFKILKTTLVVGTPVTTASKAATITPKISGIAVTGGVITANSTNCTPMGALVAGTSVTAANTGAATDSISLTASSVTAFVEGSASVLVEIQNMDSADAHASTNAFAMAVRTALVNLGLIKGS